MYPTNNLSHGEAQAMIDAVRTKAEKAGKAVSVAVSDSHGELLAFLRMDGCPFPPIANAINKAFTAARERSASGDLGKRMRESGQPMTNFADLRYIAWGGGLPILHDGSVVGAIGVSGLSEAEDVELARAGMSALK